MKIAALIPTLHRPEGLIRVLSSLRDTAPDVQIVVAVDDDDETAKHTARLFGAAVAVCKEPRQGCAYAWNTAMQSVANADIYIIGSDDCIFTEGWLEAALRALNKMGGSGLVGFNARWKKTDVSFHYMMTRDFIIEHHGGVAAIPHYSSWCVDSEACERAMRAGKYVRALDAIVLHEWLGPDGDETYRIAKARRTPNKDLFFRRQEQGFPDDFDPILRKTDDD